jgi:hypothetical protein
VLVGQGQKVKSKTLSPKQPEQKELKVWLKQVAES